MHDAMALYEVMFPDAIESEGCEVQVETGGEFARGATFFSRGHRYRDSTTRVGVSVENDLFRARLRQAMVSLD
jgi:inosine-uridine nucleoside N-ribohydrolase